MPKKAVNTIPKGWPPLPFVMHDASSYTGTRILVLERSVKAWRGISYSVAAGHVIDRIMPDVECSNEYGRKKYYPVPFGAQDERTPQVCKEMMVALRGLAMAHGAEPEAIRLLHDYVESVNEKEVEAMTEKLTKKKAAPKKAAAEKKPAAEAKAPKAKGKGNAEALKKAREARAETGPDVRKITVVTKENPFREGSGRADCFNLLKPSKTVQDYKDAGGKVKYINRWEAEGHIKLS